jgi:poly(3-hydroxybutyrate) depolymerase
MRSSVRSNVVLTGLIAGLTSIYGCSSSGGGNTFGSGGSTGATGGATGSGGAATGGSTGTGGDSTGGTSGSGGAVGTGGAATGSGGATDGGPTDMSSDMTTMTNDITKVRPTAGCGMAPTGTGDQTIQTMGTKPTGCADSKCGAWSYPRQYNVVLPSGYVNTKAYPLVFEGPGCGGHEMDVYPLSLNGNNAGNTVIRVGLNPPPNTIGHATNPGQGCFDDKEGDDSVDWVFYENLWDKLAGQICFDQNRVFASGNSSGAWFSNEVGCKYAGDATHPIRGIMPNTGGLPSQPMYEPTCTSKPLSGMWMGDIEDPENPFSNNIFAMNRAAKVNGCTTTYEQNMNDPFPIGGGNAANQCKKFKGCPDLYPIIFCTVDNKTHDSHENMAEPGFSTFLQMFQKAPFLTP